MVFIQKMGSMNDVPVLGHDFNTWFPLLLAAYVAVLALNWWERCASKLFIARRFRFDTVSQRGGRGWAGSAHAQSEERGSLRRGQLLSPAGRAAAAVGGCRKVSLVAALGGQPPRSSPRRSVPTMSTPTAACGWSS